MECPCQRCATGHPPPQKLIREWESILLIRLPQRLIILLGLLLQQLHLARETLVLRAGLCALVDRPLGVGVCRLEFLDLALGDGQLVLQRSDLLLLL